MSTTSCPWRVYSLDLGHNFVLAHPGCNSSKSDLLAAEKHLERWTERTRTRRDELEEGFDQLRVLHDWPKSRQIAHWAYGQAHNARRKAWVGPKLDLEPLSGTGGGYWTWRARQGCDRDEKYTSPYIMTTRVVILTARRLAPEHVAREGIRPGHRDRQGLWTDVVNRLSGTIVSEPERLAHSGTPRWKRTRATR